MCRICATVQEVDEAAGTCSSSASNCEVEELARSWRGNHRVLWLNTPDPTYPYYAPAIQIMSPQCGQAKTSRRSATNETNPPVPFRRHAGQIAPETSTVAMRRG